MQTVSDFLHDLSSAAPTPGGGGASALAGAVGASLCSMVASLTDGKKKYAAYQADIARILQETARLRDRLLNLMKADEEAFRPLSAAYGIPKEDPDRPDILEQALIGATEVPLNLMRTLAELTPILEELAEKGSKMAVSDVGVAASVSRSAMEGASMNVWINTRSMRDRERAEICNREASALLAEHCPRCSAVFDRITEELRA